MILSIVAKTQETKAQAVVILILMLLLITGGFIKSIGIYKSKYISYS